MKEHREDGRPRLTLLITGATGFIGRRLAQLALEKGHVVRTLTRAGWTGPPDVPSGARYLGALPFGVPVECLDGVDIVVHCAALTSGGTEASARAVNVDGTVQLARAAAQADVRRFLFISSQSARPQSPTAYGRTKWAAEEALRAVEGLNSVVVRPGLVYGAGSRGLHARLCRLVDRLPILLLPATGNASIQPIHVDDLCAALLRVAESEGTFSSPLRLGDPDAITLEKWLDEVAVARRGSRKLMFRLPLAPMRLALRAGEALGLPLGVGRENLSGLESLVRMESADDLTLLGVQLRPLAQGLAACEPGSRGRGVRVAIDRRPVGVMLVGAGRIGTMHALSLLRQPGIHVSAVVDPSHSALRQFRGLGLTGTTVTSSLESALSLDGLDAAVVASPPDSHLPLARRCLAAGLHVLVEKPLAASAADLDGFETLGRDYPGRQIQPGYLLARSPHARATVERIRCGRYGRVRAFLTGAFVTHLHGSGIERWETDPARSGGGVLANSAPHVLSLVREAFGDPDVVDTQLTSVSRRVEDAVVVRLGYGDFDGLLITSWRIAGFPRQENRLVVWTEAGRITITNAAAVVEHTDGHLEILHQLDQQTGFNLMPDYFGGGMAQEHLELALAVRNGSAPAFSLESAVGTERLLLRTYRDARQVARFDESPLKSQLPFGFLPREPFNDVTFPRLLDIRDLASDARFLRTSASAWTSLVVFPHQLEGLDVDPGSLHVVVPDFHVEARLAAGKHWSQLLGVWGVLGAVRGAEAAMVAALRGGGLTFWVALETLVAAGLARIPRTFAGTILLHGALVDLAVAGDRPEVVARLVALCRRHAPRARVGLQTAHLPQALARTTLDFGVDAMFFLSSPGAIGLRDAVGTLRKANPAMRLVAEVGNATSAVQRRAARDPGAWAHGADAVLVGAAADADAEERLLTRREAEWRAAFAGLPFCEALVS